MHRDIHDRTIAGWRFLLFTVFLAGLIGTPEAHAEHICNQPGFECRPAEAGAWTFWVSIGVSNPGGIFPVTTARFATEGAAIAAGSAAVCLPDGDHRLGYTTCSCSVTSAPTLTTLASSLGLESYRGPGSQGIASYLIDYSNLGTCDSSSPWQLAWSVAGERTIACPAGFTADGPFFPQGHNPAQACYRGISPPSPCQSNHIRLQGPGGTAGALADAEPGASVNTLSARVTCDGQPVSDKAVTLNTNVVSLSGGHQHDQGPRPRPSGTVSFNASDTTDANGDVSFTFTAPAPAGDHTITAQCADGSCGMDTGSVWVGIQGLETIGSGPWQLTGARPEHPDNHYLNVPAFLVLQQLGLQWRRFYVPFGPVFRVNDASLVRGGLFDCCETYRDRFDVFHNRQIEGWWTPPHVEHRRGTVVDIGGIRRADEVRFRQEAATLGADAAIHGAGTGRHFHVRLRGVIE